ncbi:MAG: hypothetical protein ACK56F_31870 [bacterium]
MAPETPPTSGHARLPAEHAALVCRGTLLHERVDARRVQRKKVTTVLL